VGGPPAPERATGVLLRHFIAHFYQPEGIMTPRHS
jgi:hypothetical protein